VADAVVVETAGRRALYRVAATSVVRYDDAQCCATAAATG